MLCQFLRFSLSHETPANNQSFVWHSRFLNLSSKFRTKHVLKDYCFRFELLDQFTRLARESLQFFRKRLDLCVPCSDHLPQIKVILTLCLNGSEHRFEHRPSARQQYRKETHLLQHLNLLMEIFVFIFIIRPRLSRLGTSHMPALSAATTFS